MKNHLITRHLLFIAAALLLAAAGQVQAQSAAAAQGKTVQVDGTTIFYQARGQGQPLLLIHGYPLSGDLFAAQRLALSGQFKVITPDLPGFGHSGNLQDNGGKNPQGNVSIGDYAETMLGFMDALGIEQAVIGGHSMGGMITLAMYKRAPERFDGMLLIDTAAIAAPLPRYHLWLGYAKAASKSGGKSMIVELLIPNMFSGDTRLSSAPEVGELKAIIGNASTEGLIAGAYALAQRQSFVDVLSKVDVPALIIVGSDDTLTPIALAKSMNNKIPNSVLAIIADASHAAVIEAPSEVNMAISLWWENKGGSNANSSSGTY